MRGISNIVLYLEGLHMGVCQCSTGPQHRRYPPAPQASSWTDYRRSSRVFHTELWKSVFKLCFTTQQIVNKVHTLVLIINKYKIHNFLDTDYFEKLI